MVLSQTPAPPDCEHSGHSDNKPSRVPNTNGQDPSRRGNAIDDNDAFRAFRGDCAFRHLECRRHRAIGKQSFSAAERNRKYLQPERIDQIMLEEHLKEICASINVQIRPFLLLCEVMVFGRRPRTGQTAHSCAFLWPLKQAATGIFLWPAWGLYDSIKGDKFKHINFSHD